MQHPLNTEQPIQQIAIIGAGISGLACASALQNAGLTVTLFEKSRGPSGRMSTRIAANWQCDHGAQYFTARDAEFEREVQRWQQAGVAALWQPRLQIFDGDNFSSKLSNCARYVGTPTNTAPARFLAQSLTLNTEVTINNIQRLEMQNANHCWQLGSLEQGVIEQVFDAVILAIPAPQASVLLQSASAAMAAIASSVTMRGCWSLICRFETALALDFDGLFINGQLLSWVARDSAKPGRDGVQNQGMETWVLHASSTWSEAHIEHDPEQVAILMLNEFLKIAGVWPTTHTMHRWRYAEAANYLALGSVWDDVAHIGLCGDWLNQGKVQGAWLSGSGLAKKLLHQGKVKPELGPNP
jgi:predicted NAD/FAD-dependent oxidoreductase